MNFTILGTIFAAAFVSVLLLQHAKNLRSTIRPLVSWGHHGEAHWVNIKAMIITAFVVAADLVLAVYLANQLLAK